MRSPRFSAVSRTRVGLDDREVRRSAWDLRTVGMNLNEILPALAILGTPAGIAIPIYMKNRSTSKRDEEY